MFVNTDRVRLCKAFILLLVDFMHSYPNPSWLDDLLFGLSVC